MTRLNRVQHMRSEGIALRHYILELAEDAGWWLLDSRKPECRKPLGATKPAAIRRFREVADPNVPAVVRGAS